LQFGSLNLTNNVVSLTTPYYPAKNPHQPGGTFGQNIRSEIVNASLRITPQGNMLVFSNNVQNLGDPPNQTLPGTLSNGSQAAWYEMSIGSLLDPLNPNINAVQGGVIDFNTSTENADTFSPSVDVASNGQIGLTFDSANSNADAQQFPSMWITGQSPTDAPNTMETPILIVAGQNFFSTNFFYQTDVTWGEGAWGPGGNGVAVDPTSGLFWAASQFANQDPTANWGTQIAAFALPPPSLQSGTFFTDGGNQLWVLNETTHSFINTGGFAKAFSAGLDLGGTPECWFIDGNNQLWRWVGGNFTNTGAFASNFSAGLGMVFFTDGNNMLWTYRDFLGFNNTGAFATVFAGGFNRVGQSELSFLDGASELWIYDVHAGTITPTGGFAVSLRQGQDVNGQNQTYFLDGNNQLYRYDAFAATPFTSTGGFAQPANYFGSQGRVYFLDGNNTLWLHDDVAGFTDTFGSAMTISSSPGTPAVFFRDGANGIWMYQGGVFTNTHAFGVVLSAF
jgi:hypothetical protein